ncbi:conserved hypothetical protein [Culex quinquefasciatus]|uniref:N-acetyltransferase domain-containing protein n=1 Tax=Culex quinquefasciatus TaxID=7176 RepID=B0WN74_CULQU|nr:conserved hypothetical protein [Culex quinquefasciatus]|eukprot:XP_001850158.1 conserved hypothetical protein [Culex quinquefasciatus]
MRMSSIPAHGREGKWDVVSHVAESLITSTMQYNITMDGKVDLFQKFGIDCLFEIMFLAMQVGFEGKGIASALVACLVELAKKYKS